jgi:hypothetical protein
MEMNLLDNSLKIEVFFDREDETFSDNICLRIRKIARMKNAYSGQRNPTST